MAITIYSIILSNGYNDDDFIIILSTGSDTVITNHNNIVLAVVQNTQAFEIAVEDFIF